MSDTFFLIVGIILSELGIITIASGIFSRKNCTESVIGTITCLDDKKHYHKGKIYHKITPIVKYTFNDRFMKAGLIFLPEITKNTALETVSEYS